MNDEVTEFSCKEECVNDEQEHATTICHIEPDCNGKRVVSFRQGFISTVNNTGSRLTSGWPLVSL